MRIKQQTPDCSQLYLPWLHSAALALLAFASTTVDSSLMISLKIFTSRGILVHLSGSGKQMRRVRGEQDSADPVSLFLSRRRHRSVWRLTLDGLGARADAVLVAVYLFSLHNDVLETFVVFVEAMLQQLAQGHRAAGRRERDGLKENGRKAFRFQTW